MGTVLIERERVSQRERLVKKQSVYAHGRSDSHISLGCEQSVSRTCI